MCVCVRVALLGVLNFLSTASCYIFIENSFVTRENSVKRKGSRALLEAAFREDFNLEKREGTQMDPRDATIFLRVQRKMKETK